MNARWNLLMSRSIFHIPHIICIPISGKNFENVSQACRERMWLQLTNSNVYTSYSSIVVSSSIECVNIYSNILHSGSSLGACSFNHPSTSTEGPNVGSEGVEFVDFSVEDPSFKRDVIEPFQKTILQPILKNLCM